MQLDSLMAELSLRGIKKALNKLPEELDAMYDQTLERIREAGPKFASLGLMIIRWVLHAARPLSLLEIRHALAVEVDDKSFDEEGLIDEELLEPSCAGLITVQEHGTVRLVHYTAQEYLSRKSSVLFPGTDAIIANICLTYIRFENVRDIPGGIYFWILSQQRKRPFLRYAIQHWSQHMRAIPDSDLDEEVLGFFAQKSNVPSWHQALMPFATKHLTPKLRLEYRSLNGLFLASMHGLHSICKKFLDQGGDVNSTDPCGYTPLHYATNYDHGNVVQLLLKAGANLEITAEVDCRTVLHLAAWNGHEGIVQQLLEKGAETAAVDRLGFTALHLASLCGHQKILRTLLENNSSIVKILNRATAPHCVADSYYEHLRRCLVLQTLLENNSNIVKTINRATAYEHLRQCLDEGYATIDNGGDRQQTALILAEEIIKVEAVSLLCQSFLEGQLDQDKWYLLPFIDIEVVERIMEKLKKAWEKA